MQHDVPAIDFLGLAISAVDSDGAARLIAGRDPGLPFAYVVTPNAQHMVWLAQGDAHLRQAYESAWLRLSDGNVVRRIA